MLQVSTAPANLAAQSDSNAASEFLPQPPQPTLASVAITSALRTPHSALRTPHYFLSP